MQSVWRKNLTESLNGRKVIIATAYEATNLTEAIENDPHSIIWLTFVKEFFHFINYGNYEVVKSNGEAFGTAYNETTWTGIVGMLQNEEADIGIDLSLTLQRYRVIEFSYPLVISKVCIVTKEPVPYLNSLYFMKVFSANNFVLIFTSILIVSSLTILFESVLRGHKTNLVVFVGNILWRASKLLSADAVNRKSALSVQQLCLTWLLALQAFVLYYNNSIYSELAVPTKPKPINTVQDFLNAVEKGDLTWGIQPESAMHDLFKNASQGAMQKLWNLAEPLTNSPKEAYNNRILNENYAYVDLDMNSKIMNSSFHTSTSGFVNFLEAFGFAKNSPFTTPCSIFAHRVREIGLVHRWQTEVQIAISRKPESVVEEDSRKHKLTLDIMKRVFYLLLIGYVLSNIAFLAEITSQKIGKKKLNIEEFCLTKLKSSEMLEQAGQNKIEVVEATDTIVLESEVLQQPATTIIDRFPQTQMHDNLTAVCVDSEDGFVLGTHTLTSKVVYDDAIESDQQCEEIET